MERRSFLVTFGAGAAAALAPSGPTAAGSVSGFAGGAVEPRYRIVVQDSTGRSLTVAEGTFSRTRSGGLAEISNGSLCLDVTVTPDKEWRPRRAEMHVEHEGCIGRFEFHDWPVVSPGENVTITFALR